MVCSLFLFSEPYPSTRRQDRPPLLTLALVVALGWFDEVIQYYLPDRYYDLSDVVDKRCWRDFGAPLQSGLQKRRIQKNIIKAILELETSHVTRLIHCIIMVQIIHHRPDISLI